MVVLNVLKVIKLSVLNILFINIWSLLNDDDGIFRDLSSAVYGSFSQGTSSNVVDQRGTGECHVANQNDGNMQAWPQGYTLYPQQHHHIQHNIVGTDHHHQIQGMMPHGQMNMPITASQVEPPKNESTTEFDQCKQPNHQLHAQWHMLI